ncbi:type III secretion system chaperone family protein [Actinomycetospora sp. C-140]
MPAWVWFVIAALAAGGGALLLLSDRARTGGHRRDRRRWAEQKSWEFVDVDPVLPSRWRYGAVHQGGHGRALDLATGAVPGPGGRRLAHVFDHEQAGQITGIVAAVRGVATLPVALELRLPSAPLPDDAGLDSLGQVGERYAFVTSVAQARPLITPDVARVADLVGDDVPLLWAEDTWVLATIDAGADPERVQTLLQALVEVSVALEDAAVGTDDEGYEAAAPEGHDGTEDVDDHDDPRPTHRDSPADIPYDVEDDEFGPGARSSSSSGR